MIRTGKATAVVTLGIALVFAGRQLPAQNGGENALGRRIEGTWLLQATLRQCDTGAEIPNSTIPVLHTFLSGGAMLSNPATSGLSTGMACGRTPAAIPLGTRFVCLRSLQVELLRGWRRLPATSSCRQTAEV